MYGLPHRDVTVLCGLLFLFRRQFAPAPQQAYSRFSLQPVFRIEHLLDRGQGFLSKAKDLAEGFLSHLGVAAWTAGQAVPQLWQSSR